MTRIGLLGAYLAVALTLAFGLLRTKLIAVELGLALSGFAGLLSSLVALTGAVACLGLWSSASKVYSAPALEDEAAGLTGLLIVASTVLGLLVAVVFAWGKVPELVGFGSMRPTPVAVGVLTIGSALSGIAIIWWRCRGPWWVLPLIALAGGSASCMLLLLEAVDPRFRVELSLMVGMSAPSVVWIFVVVRRWALIRLLKAGFDVGYWFAPIVASLSFLLARAGSDLAARSVLIEQSGETANAYLQPYYVYASVLLPQVMSVAMVLFLGVIYSQGGTISLNGSALRFFGLVAAGGVVVAGIPEVFVVLAFSDEFLPGASALRVAGLAECLRWAVIAVVSVVVGRGAWRRVLALSIISFLLRVSLVGYLARDLGPASVPTAVGLESALTLMLVTLMFRESFSRAMFQALCVLSVMGFLTMIGVASIVTV